MFKKSNLQVVEELDDLETASRGEAAIQEKLTRKSAKLAAVEARLVAIATEIKNSAMGDDTNEALDGLFKEQLLGRGAVEALEVVVRELEGELAAARARGAEVRRARLLADAQAALGPAREALMATHAEVARTLAAFQGSVEADLAAVEAYDQIRAQLAAAGCPVGAEPGTMSVLAALGAGPLAFTPFRRRLEVAVPAAVFFSK